MKLFKNPFRDLDPEVKAFLHEAKLFFMFITMLFSITMIALFLIYLI